MQAGGAVDQHHKGVPAPEGAMGWLKLGIEGGESERYGGQTSRKPSWQKCTPPPQLKS